MNRIVTLADKRYFNYVKALAWTAKEFCPSYIFHVVLVNFKNKEENSAIIKKINNNSEIEFESVKFLNKKEKMCYCTNRRGHILNKLRNETDDVLIWIDADSLIRKSLDELLEVTNGYDVANRGPMAGLLVIYPTDGAKIFTAKYSEYLKNKAIWKQWFSNQSILSEYKKKFKNRVRWKTLGFKFLETRMKDSGLIWSLKHSTRKNKKFNLKLKEILANLE